MQDLLDRIRERNFQKNIEFRKYTGNKDHDFNLIDAGVDVLSVFVNNQDLGVTVYGFNDKRSIELGINGKPDETKEIDYIITEIIHAKFP